MQVVWRPFSLARARVGSNSPASTAMMAITTRSSMSVKHGSHLSITRSGSRVPFGGKTAGQIAASVSYSRRVNQGTQTTASRDARDGWQGLLPEYTLFNCGSETVGRCETPNTGKSRRKTAVNRHQPGYSGIKRINDFIFLTSDLENQATGLGRQNLHGGECRTRFDSDGSNHAKTRVNALKYGYARVDTAIGKIIFCRSISGIPGARLCRFLRPAAACPRRRSRSYFCACCGWASAQPRARPFALPGKSP